MPADPESFLGVDPPSSGTPPASPTAPESPDARLARLSQNAFWLGIVGAIASSILTAVLIIRAAAVAWGGQGLSGRKDPSWEDWLILPCLGVLAVSFALLIVSLVWGLRVVNSRRYVLWWVIPTGLILALFVVAVAFCINETGFAGAPNFWGFVTVTVAVLMIEAIARWGLPRQAKRQQPGLSDSSMTGNSAKNEPAPPIKLESSLRVAPPSAKSPPKPPAPPEPPATRLARLSRNAFLLGLGGIVAGLLLAAVSSDLRMEPGSDLEGGPPQDYWVIGLRLFASGFFAAAVAPLTVSIDWGRRVLKSRRQVLWWIVPAGLVVPLLGLFVVVSVVGLVIGPAVKVPFLNGWRIPVALVLAYFVWRVVQWAVWAGRRETRRHETAVKGLGITGDTPRRVGLT